VKKKLPVLSHIPPETYTVHGEDSSLLCVHTDLVELGFCPGGSDKTDSGQCRAKFVICQFAVFSCSGNGSTEFESLS